MNFKLCWITVDGVISVLVLKSYVILMEVLI